MAQGVFPIGSILTAQQIEADPRMDACLEVWSINLPEGSQQLRFQLPKGCDPDKVLLRLRDAAYNWQDVPFTTDGDYLIISAQNGDLALQLVKAPVSYTVWILMGVMVPVVGILVTAAILAYRKKKKNF